MLSNAQTPSQRSPGSRLPSSHCSSASRLPSPHTPGAPVPEDPSLSLLASLDVAASDEDELSGSVLVIVVLAVVLLDASALVLSPLAVLGLVVGSEPLWIVGSSGEKHPT